MTVELQVYSGRPNPSWQLDGQDVAELQRRLTNLPRRRQSFVEGGLGYGGFVIKNPEKAGGLPALIYVLNGVGVLDRDGIASYEDARDLELWLLDQARGRGHGAILSELGKGDPR